MMRVSRNCIIDHYRKLKTERRQTRIRWKANMNRLQNPAIDSQIRLRFWTSGNCPNGFMARWFELSEDLREVLILRDLEGFAYEEIVEIVSVPIGTVKSRINRGRVEMAKMLKRDSQ